MYSWFIGNAISARTPMKSLIDAHGQSLWLYFYPYGLISFGYLNSARFIHGPVYIFQGIFLYE
jgi:hypothetical protein